MYGLWIKTCIYLLLCVKEKNKVTCHDTQYQECLVNQKKVHQISVKSSSLPEKYCQRCVFRQISSPQLEPKSPSPRWCEGIGFFRTIALQRWPGGIVRIFPSNFAEVFFPVKIPQFFDRIWESPGCLFTESDHVWLISSLMRRNSAKGPLKNK